MCKSKIKFYMLIKALAALFLMLLLLSSSASGALSDKRLCADEKCHDIISVGRSLVSYTASEKGMVSFKINSRIQIKSKSAGSNMDLWGISVNGREGYVPKRFILEEKVLVPDKNLKFEVPTMADGLSAKPATNTAETNNLNKETETPKVPTTPLKPSESAELKADIESTTTSPLPETAPKTPEILNSLPSEQSPPDSTNATDASVSPPALGEITPVQNKVEIVDGTAIPIMEELVTESVLGDKENQEQTKPNDDDSKKDSTLAKETENEIKTKAFDDVALNDIDDDDDVVGDYDDDEMEDEDIYSETTETSKNVKDQNEKIEKPIVEKEAEEKVKEKTPDSIVEDVTKKEVEQTLKDEEKQPEMTTEANNLPEEVAILSNEPKKIETVTENIKTLELKPIPEKIDNIVNETVDSPASADVNVSTNDSESAKPQSTIPSETTTATTATETQSNVDHRDANDVVHPIGSMPTNDDDDGSEDDDDDDSKNREDINQPLNQKIDEKIPEKVESKINSENDSVNAVPHDSDNKQNLDENLMKETDNTTPTPILEITESGFELPANLPNWPHSEDGATTTPSPIIMQQTQETVNVDNGSQYLDNNISTEASNVADSPVASNDPKTDKPEEEAAPVVTEIPTYPSTPIVSIEQKQQQNEHHQHSEDDHHQHQHNHNHYGINDHQHYNGHQHEHQDVNSQNPHDPHYHHPQYPYQDQQNPNTQFDYTTNHQHRDEQIERGHHDHNHESNHNHWNTQETTSKQEIPQQLETNEMDSTIKATPKTEQPRIPEEEPYALPVTAPSSVKVEEVGLFATIVGTVKGLLGNQKRDASTPHLEDDELQRILFPERTKTKQPSEASMHESEYCERLSRDHCPETYKQWASEISRTEQSACGLADMNFDNFVDILGAKVLEMRDLIACLSIASASVLLFIFGYYCFCKSTREGALLSKLNLLERSLLAMHKENAILKDDLFKTRSKLSSIEDNSFGSNDMVIAVKQELEIQHAEKQQLQEQIKSLEKELENAAEAGLELNKIVSELLSNQTGDESIISSVEELQRQLNEQQQTILEINANLAEKSRENSELQLMIAEQNARLSGEIASLQQDNDELEAEKGNLKQSLEEIKSEFDENITIALEGKNAEIKRLQNEILDLKTRIEDEHTKWQTSLAKVEALEECLKSVKKDPSVNINEVIDVANVKAELLDLQKKRLSLKGNLDAEMDARKLAESQLQISLAEVEKLKQDFNQSEKDKLEAQTRLEVLSNYFKDKETQLQKELSVKEAMWLSQQGEKTSTVERVTTMQNEIQSLKSQNDSLRAEIEAQLAAHKAQIGTLENRAHETWLAARQSERRYEEARSEATALRRKLTALAGTNVNDINRVGVTDGPLNSTELNTAPSPIHMDTAGSPLLSRLPPPPPFLPPPPFMGQPPPFLNMPPPPFLTPAEMRPAPLGRMMSPPLGARYSPPDNRRYYDDYDDEDDDVSDDDEYDVEDRSRDRGRYSYTTDRDLISTYDTETDLSPPPSPRRDHHHHRRGRRDSDGDGGGSDEAEHRSGSYRTYSPRPIATSSTLSNENKLGKSSTQTKGKSKKNGGKGVFSSGSEKSSNSVQRKNKKSMV